MSGNPVRHCWPWTHVWTKWDVIERGVLQKLVDPLGLPIHEEFGEHTPVVGYYELQRRECSECHKSQLRKVTI